MKEWTAVCAILLSFAVYGESPPEAPKFSVKDLEGEMVILDSLLSRGPVYVSFWAIWCKPCIRELDELAPIYEKYRERGLELLAISEDGPRSIHRVKPLVRGKRWKFRVLLDLEKELLRAFQVVSLPTSFLIDRDGKIVNTYQGFKPGMEKLIEEELTKLLADGEEEGGADSEVKDQER